MKPNNAGDDRWPRAETANYKLKQDSKLKEADDIQTMYEFCRAQLEAITQQNYVSLMAAPSPRTTHISAETLSKQYGAL